MQIILQLHLHFQLNNYPIRPPNVAWGDLGNWKLWPFKCQGHPVSLWSWRLTCNLEKCYSLRSYFGMYNLERRLWYLHLLTRHCPSNLLPEPSSPKHEYKGKLWGHPVTLSMTSSPWKNLLAKFGTIFSHLRSNWSCVWYLKILKMVAILSSRQTFYRKLYWKLNMPER